jgi:hypothetical protein
MQTGCFHRINDPVATLFDNSRRTIPMAARTRTRERTIMHAVDISKYPVFIR